MKEAELFRAYGMEPTQPIPETTKCATPRCKGETLFPAISIFCSGCDARTREKAVWRTIKDAGSPS